MPVLTLRISDDEKRRLVRRAKDSGISAGALVRKLISEPTFTTADDLLAEMTTQLGNSKLRVRQRK